jgi:hypothetical protein
MTPYRDSQSPDEAFGNPMVTCRPSPAVDVEAALVVRKRAMGESVNSSRERLFCDDIVARGTQVG